MDESPPPAPCRRLSPSGSNRPASPSIFPKANCWLLRGTDGSCLGPSAVSVPAVGESRQRPYGLAEVVILRRPPGRAIIWLRSSIGQVPPPPHPPLIRKRRKEQRRPADRSMALSSRPAGRSATNELLPAQKELTTIHHLRVVSASE